MAPKRDWLVSACIGARRLPLIHHARRDDRGLVVLSLCAEEVLAPTMARLGSLARERYRAAAVRLESLAVHALNAAALTPLEGT